MLHLNDVTLRIGGRTLLEHASVHLPAGLRAGLVGANGSGKTSLLRLILGELTPDAGELRLRRRARVGWVAQEAPGGERTPRQAVLEADQERAHLLRAADAAVEAHAIAEIQTRLADIGAHAAPARASAILAGLGFDEQAQQRPLASFSGGWRMRVALAAVLFAEPDLLLLDEPTNHLDLEASLWLEDYLRRYPKTLLLVSHDRDLLNRGARAHRAPGSAEAHRLRRRLRRVRAHPARAADAPGQGTRQARGAAQAHAGVRRPLPLQGEQGAPGAEPAQGDREARSRSRR